MPNIDSSGYGWYSRFAQRATIESVDGDTVYVRDTFGKRRSIPASAMRAHGMRPRVGEMWLIDRSTGNWAFAALLDPLPPTISGDCDGNTVLFQLLQLLDEAGLIVNNTVLGEHPHPVD